MLSRFRSFLAIVHTSAGTALSGTQRHSSALVKSHHKLLTIDLPRKVIEGALGVLIGCGDVLSCLCSNVVRSTGMALCSPKFIPLCLSCFLFLSL
jgi:hypothetical protein